MIGKRIWDVLRSNISRWVERFEDPEKIIEQSLLDMQETLSCLRQKYVAASAGEKRMQARLKEISLQAAKNAERARLYVEKGDEQTARRELAKEVSAEKIVERYKAQAARQAELVGSLKSSLSDLENKVEEAKRKREELQARQAAAIARREIGAAFAGVSDLQTAVDVHSFGTFERMEDRVRSLEAESEALAELQSEMVRFGGLSDFMICSEDILIEKRLNEIKNAIQPGKEKGL